MADAGVVTSGSAFIRSLPESMAADEVVTKAAEAGFEVSKGLVHSVRSAARKKKPEMTPTEFIRAHPGVAPSELKKMALERGIVFTTSLVAYTRKADAKKAALNGSGAGASKTRRRAKKRSLNGHGNGAASHGHPLEEEADVVGLLRSVAGVIGFSRSIVVLQEEVDRVAAILAGSNVRS